MMKEIAGPAGQLVVDEYGSGGLPLMLLHGMAGDADFWRETVGALGNRRHLIIPELRGHGRSSPSADGAYTIRGFADDVVAVLDDLQLPRVVIVGHSFGASVAIEVASLVPERIAALVLVDPAGDFSFVPSEAIAGFLDGLDHDESYTATVEGAFDVALESAHPETERRVRAAILSAPRPLVRAMYHALLGFHPVGRLDRYTGPVLLVTAPVNASTFALHELRPALPRRRMEGVSHWLMMDKPVIFAGIVEEFLQGVA